MSSRVRLSHTSVGWLNRRAFVNGITYFHLRVLLSRYPFKKEDIEQIRLRKLNALLLNAYSAFPFYRERIDQAGIVPGHVSSLSELERMPLLTKKEYRTLVETTIAENPGRYEGWYWDSTSGSTGMPLRICRTWNERAYMVAKWMRALVLNGYRCQDVTFSLPSPHRLQRDSILQKVGLLSRFQVPYTASPEEMVSQYQKVKPDLLYGNKSQLVQMALHMQHEQIPAHQPRIYCCAAECLDDTSKTLLADTFGSGLFEVYGACEFNTLAWQTGGNPWYWISHDTNILEVLDNNGTPSTSGRCVVTDLHITSFPLIRYDLGDTIETETKDNLPVITKIKGRLDDVVVFNDGTRLPFHHFYEIFGKYTELLQFRVVQETITLIRVELVLSDVGHPESVAKAIQQDLKSGFGHHEVDWKIVFREEIPPDPSGKLRMLVSSISPKTPND